jgi:hypothetical protein
MHFLLMAARDIGSGSLCLDVQVNRIADRKQPTDD